LKLRFRSRRVHTSSRRHKALHKYYTWIPTHQELSDAEIYSDVPPGFGAQLQPLLNSRKGGQLRVHKLPFQTPVVISLRRIMQISARARLIGRSLGRGCPPHFFLPASSHFLRFSIYCIKIDRHPTKSQRTAHHSTFHTTSKCAAQREVFRFLKRPCIAPPIHS
jgi:hypothetical protein